MTLEQIIRNIETARNRLRIVHGIEDSNGYHLQLMCNMESVVMYLHGNNYNLLFASTKNEAEQLIKDYLELRNRIAAGEEAPTVVHEYIQSH